MSQQTSSETIPSEPIEPIIGKHGSQVGGHTPGPWEYVKSNEHHGPYVCGPYGGDICDCYTMSNLAAASVRNGGTSYPIHFQHEHADANARLIAAAPDLLAALQEIERGLANTGSDPLQWMTRIRKPDAWKIASEAIAKATAAR